MSARMIQAWRRSPVVKSGYLVRTIKIIGSGRNQEVVEEYAFDAALARERRATAEQAAKELGQWVDKGDITSGGEPIKGYIAIDPDRV